THVTPTAIRGLTPPARREALNHKRRRRPIAKFAHLPSAWPPIPGRPGSLMETQAMPSVPYVIEQRGREERVYDIYSRLLRDRIVFLQGEIDDESANVIVAQLLV